MKLPGDPWNNRWSSFYGIAWNFSIENVDAGISMEIGVLLIFHGIPWEMS